MPDPSCIIVHTAQPTSELEILRRIHPDLDMHGCDSYEALPGLIEQTGAEAIYTVRFAGTPDYPRDAVLRSPSMRWVSIGGSGVDHLGAWDPALVTVTNTAGVASDMLAEYAFGAMLSFSLDLRGFQRHQEDRRWISGRVEKLQGKTLAILGLGKTGQAVARRARAFGMTTLGIRARPTAMPDVDEVHGAEALAAVLRRADFIVCCLPLSLTTRGMLDAAAFAAMKPRAVLVDISRGGVIDETALLSALETGVIRGAALDVFATEPLPAGHPFWSYDNVIITPHCAAVYDGWETQAVRMFGENLTRYRNGDPLQNVVDPVRGY